MGTSARIALFCVFSSSLQAAIDYVGGTYVQDFNALPGWAEPWTNGVTLPGWYIYKGSGTQAPYRPDAQWQAVTAMDASILDQVMPLAGGSTDVSLGLLSRPTDLCVALVLRNATTNTLDRLSLSFFGEQWEDIGEVREGTAPIQFSFGVFQTFSDAKTSPSANPNTIIPNSPEGDSAAFNNGYRKVSWLDFGPFVTHGMVGKLDGHQPENRKELGGFPRDFCWPPGQFLVLRWFDDNDSAAGVRQTTLALNDVKFSATAAPGIDICYANRLNNGDVLLAMCGDPGVRGELQASYDLLEWQTLATITLDNGSAEYTDPGTNADHRFYRVTGLN